MLKKYILDIILFQKNILIIKKNIIYQNLDK